MSRLMKSLERLRRDAGGTLGFGFAAKAARPQKQPAMLLVAASAKVDQAAPSAKLADGFLLLASASALNAAGKKLSDSAGDLPWGMQAERLTAEQVTALKEQKCDFLVLTSLTVPLEALHLDDQARILALESAPTPEQSRALGALPIDAVLAAQPVSSPVDIQRLLDLATMRSFIPKAFFARADAVPTAWEIECLRDIGVDGIMLNVDKAGAEALGALHAALREVQPRKARGGNTVALLPTVGAGAGLPGRQAPPPATPDEDDDQ
jgi:hypothetical protein